MKTLLKILVALVVVAGLCFGVYCVLPETSQMYVKGNIQYRTDDTAKSQVDKIRNMTITQYDQEGKSTGTYDKSYGEGLENLCKSTAWYYSENSDGTWTVTFYGSKASMDLTTAGLDHAYVDVSMKVTFVVRDTNVDVTIQMKDDMITRSSNPAAFSAACEKIAAAAK